MGKSGKSGTTSVSMMEYLHTLATKIADERGITKSALIRDALDQYTAILAHEIKAIGSVKGGTMSVCLRQRDESISHSLARLGIAEHTKVSRSRIISDALAYYVGHYLSEKAADADAGDHSAQRLTVHEVLQLPSSDLLEHDRYCRSCGLAAASPRAMEMDGTWILKSGLLYCPACKEDVISAG